VFGFVPWAGLLERQGKIENQFLLRSLSVIANFLSKSKNVFGLDIFAILKISKSVFYNL